MPALADPKLLRLPLECGVTVIAAHCATKSGPLDPDYFDDWIAMLAEFPNLYGDISAMVSLNRCGHLRDCLRPEIAPRILHGSDFPVPVLGHRLWLQRRLDWPAFRSRAENRQSARARLAIQGGARICGRSANARRRLAPISARMIFTNARLIFPDGIRDGLEVVARMERSPRFARRLRRTRTRSISAAIISRPDSSICTSTARWAATRWKRRRKRSVRSATITRAVARPRSC